MSLSRRNAIGLFAAAAAYSAPRSDPKAEQILIRFPGTLRAITRREIVLEVDAEQELVFRRIRKTRFIDGGKESSEKTAPVGDHVVIEGRRAMNGDLEAVNVMWNEKPPVSM